jgi:uncharacterized protein (TIGR03435 family)
MTTRLGLLLVGLAVAALPLAAQSDAPRFDVASVKPNLGSSGTSTWSLLPSGRFAATNSELRMLIFNAYGVTPDRLLGGPDWIKSDRFDILASTAPGASESTMLTMLQALLADRFKLVLRREARETAVYSLVIAENDGRVEKALRPVDCKASPTESKAAVGKVASRCSALLMRQPGTGMSAYQSEGVTLNELANTLSRRVGRPVINRTGLAGEFQFELSWLQDLQAGAAAAPAPANDGPTLFTALQDQLGLKLESGRGPVEFLVIESVERPTPN